MPGFLVRAFFWQSLPDARWWRRRGARRWRWWRSAWRRRRNACFRSARNGPRHRHIRRHRYPVALGVHALDIGIVVLALRANPRSARAIDTDRTTHQQSCPGAGANATMAANGSAGYCTDCRADSGAGYSRLSGCIFSGLATDLNVGVLATVAIIFAEALDGITTPRQDHDGRSGRKYRTSAQKESANNNCGTSGNKFSLSHFHFPGSGSTFCQPAGQSLT